MESERWIEKGKKRELILPVFRVKMFIEIEALEWENFIWLGVNSFLLL